MRIRRNTQLLVEPPSVATGDIAFNLIIFFLVCASVVPDGGRKQSLPRSEETKQEEQKQNVEVKLTRNAVILNGDPLTAPQFAGKLRSLLSSKPRPEDKVVVVKSSPDVPYLFWIQMTELIEQAGGTITIQREEEVRVAVP